MTTNVTAWFGESLKSTALAAQNLSASQFYLVSLGPTGVSLNVTEGAGNLKVLTNTPVQGDAAQLWDIGETKVVAGAALTVGELVMSDASGRCIPYVGGDSGYTAIGECRCPANAAGDIVTVFVFPAQPVPDTVYSVGADLTAHAGGTKAAALPLTAQVNQVTTVGSAADSVLLPPAVAGEVCVVANDAATNSMDIYAQGTDVIDALATATAYALIAGDRVTFYGIAAGAWISTGPSAK